jgi:Tol biopolymer transport system component
LCNRPLTSPDGKSILFNGIEIDDLFRIQSDGGGLRRLTHSDDLYALGYDWSPDGQHIYYSRGYLSKDRTCGVWRMNADGTDKTLVLDNHAAESLAVSPSGKRLALRVERRDGRRRLYDLFVYHIGEKQTKLLSKDARRGFTWHPRHDVLLYTNRAGLYEWRASTGASRRLLSGDLSSPVITPDSKTVLLVKINGKSDSFWKLDVDSGKTEQLYPKP